MAPASVETSAGVKPARPATVGFDLKVQGRSANRVLDAVEDVDHAVDLAHPLRHLRSRVAQQRRVLGEQLDVNRLGAARQIANHVLEHLEELHVELRLLGRDPLTDVGHDVLDSADQSALSFTEMSPVLASVTAASPSCNPVRRDVLSTSGMARMICRTCWMTRSVSESELPAGMM